MSNPPLPQESTTSVNKAQLAAEEVKAFYKNEFKGLMVKFFKQPLDGLVDIFSGDTQKIFNSSLILFGSVYLAYIIGLKLLTGELLNLGGCLKFSLVPVVTMIVISGASFALKTISGKPDFKREILTGALAGIPLVLILLIVLLLKMFFGPSPGDLLNFNPMRAADDLGLAVIVGGALLFYSGLMLINVFQQSLKAANTNDALAWYISPISVFTSLYISLRIVIAVF
jgi:hypothetical protein